MDSSILSNSNARPTLHFICGKMAAGKSTLSKSLAARCNAVLICEDIWLSRLYPDEISSFDDYLKYSARLKEALKPHVIDLLGRGTDVVLDFPANVPRQRQWLRAIADAAGAAHVLHFVDTPDAACKAQLRKRNSERPDGSMVMSEEQFEQITAFFVPPADAELFTVVRYAPS
ncbi:MAG: ATP-binding protein [Telluria sp.]